MMSDARILKSILSCTVTILAFSILGNAQTPDSPGKEGKEKTNPTAVVQAVSSPGNQAPGLSPSVTLPGLPAKNAKDAKDATDATDQPVTDEASNPNPTAAPAAAGVNCTRTIKADVLAINQPYMFNRLGAARPGGMIYVLRGDARPIDKNKGWVAGNIQLKSYKRARPIVLRANVGDCLEIKFTDFLANPSDGNLYLPPANAPGGQINPDLAPNTLTSGIHVNGMQMVDNISSDSSFAGANPSSLAEPQSSISPSKSKTYKLFATAEGTYLLYSMGAPMRTGQITAGLFGAINVQPKGAEWYRSQVTEADMKLATNGTTADGHPKINYDKTYPACPASDPQGANMTTRCSPAGLPPMPVMNMLDASNNLRHSDLTGLITGPKSNGYLFVDNGEPVFRPNPASNGGTNPPYPPRIQPYREFTIIYHESTAAVQAFPQYYDKMLEDTLLEARDGFAINYGIGGIGSEILANRLQVGPMADCADCKFEEFFLSSWAVGDPAMVVDVPANVPVGSPDLNGIDQSKVSSKSIPDSTNQMIKQAYVLPPPPINDPCSRAGNPPCNKQATKAFYPDDPSNVYHSYIGDHTKFRILHGGTGVTHVHHLHAHQWLHTPNDDNSTYMDSQMLNPGAAYTLEIDYNGSGNRNQTVGDSIFHCHFYPHFAAGMWALWRTHDVFEAGTELGGQGRPLQGARALPDGEIPRGTPIPAIVPIPVNAMAPMPAKIKIIPVCDIGVSDVDCTNSSNGDRKLVIAYRADVVDKTKNPGYPFFIPGVAGGRAPHPPLDFATSQGQPLDGGLPRHLVVSSMRETVPGKGASGEVENEQHTQWDFTKDLHRLTAFMLPEKGTAIEQVAMNFHSQCNHASFTPLGVAKNFRTNGLPPQPGAPYADPATKGDCQSVLAPGGGSILRTYKAANIQMDVVFNKEGWHFPQQRMLTLWQDVAPSIKGDRPPEPFFFRANSGDVIEYWHTNLVPYYYELDDFQVRTPTDILGQHIHLVKFDVTSSDGSGNGFNYEDGTFSPDEVRDRIRLINKPNIFSNKNGLFDFDPVTQWANKNVQKVLTATPPPAEIVQGLSDPSHYNDCSDPTNPDKGIWCGAQTTVQRWYADPLLNLSQNANVPGKDRTIRTVFTHDHFGPSTHQQAGLYAALVVEPKDSKWKEPQTGTLMGTRTDGGPTGWQANIETPNAADSYREFLFGIQDMALAYGPQSKSQSQFAPYPCIGKTQAQCDAIMAARQCKFTATGVTPAQTPWGWFDTTNAINPLTATNTPAECFPVSIISGNIMGTQSANYRNEPLPNRVIDPNTNQLTSSDAGSLSQVFRSIPRANSALSVQPTLGSKINSGCTVIGKPWDPNWPCFTYPKNPLTAGMNGPDPFTPLLRAYEGDKVQVRAVVGAHMSPHYFTFNGLNWLFEPGTPNDPTAKTQNNSGYRATQPMGISEHWEMLFTTPVATANAPSTCTGPDGTTQVPCTSTDYLYMANALTSGLEAGMWGLLRAYKDTQPNLAALPNNSPGGNKPALSTGCPSYALGKRSYDVTAITAQQALASGAIIYNNRATGGGGSTLTDPLAILYVITEDLNNGNLNKMKIEPLVLRAAAGECIEVTLRNGISSSAHALSQRTSNLAQPFGSCINCSNFIGWTLNVPGAVGLHPQLLSYNVMKNDGMNVGANPVQTIKAMLPNQPPNTITYSWYAGNPPTADNPNATPIEFGAVGLFPADPLMQHQTGLIGALVIEPKGSSWLCDGGVKCDGTPNNGKVPISYTSAVVTKADNTTFREFVVVMQDDANINLTTSGQSSGTGAAGMNYRSEPMFFRYTNPPGIASQTNCPTIGNPGLDMNNCPDVWRSFSNELVQANPQTPVFTASAGQPARFRLVQPGGSTNGQVFTLHGHVWQEEPYKNNSTEIGNNPLSQWLGSRDSYGAASHYDIVLDQAGGQGAVPGDYLFRTYVGNQITKGIWGIFRVANACSNPNAANCPDTVTITAYKKQGQNLKVQGVNTVDPKTGLFAPFVNICGGNVTTCTQGSPTFLHRQAVNAISGTWEFNGTKSPPPTQVTAISDFGGRSTAAELVAPVPQAKPVVPPNPENKNSNTDRFEQKPPGAPKKPK